MTISRCGLSHRRIHRKKISTRKSCAHSSKTHCRTLPEREALVIQLYYVEELNVYEIAEVLEVTTGRVSQIKKSAITSLRHFLGEREALILKE